MTEVTGRNQMKPRIHLPLGGVSLQTQVKWKTITSIICLFSKFLFMNIGIT